MQKTIPFKGDGKYFLTHFIDADLDAAEVAAIVITTPDSSVRCHATFSVNATAAVKVQLFENPTLTGVGTALVELNTDRNSAAVTTVVATHTPTIGSNGTALSEGFIGPSSGVGMATGPIGCGEFVLKQNEQYLLLVTSQTANTQVSLSAEWFE